MYQGVKLYVATLRDRLMVGQQILDLSIGVQIPIPQPLDALSINSSLLVVCDRPEFIDEYELGVECSERTKEVEEQNVLSLYS